MMTRGWHFKGKTSVNAQIRMAVLLACAAALPVSAWAQAESGASTGALEEIVITAQKRVERLADIPVSAAVVSTDTITKLNAGDVSDLNRLVPSVNLNGTINGRVPMGMRGISSVSNEGTVGLSSGVAIMIDGVPVPSDSRAANALEDVQNVEVLKGPQATLGGRTAAAGVINVVTRKPSDVLTGNIGLMATDDGEYRANGFIAGPVSDAVQYSLAAYYTTRDFPIKNLQLDKDTNQKVYGARGKLLFKPTEDLDVTLTARIGRDNSDGFNFVYTHLTPGADLLLGTALPPPGSPPRLFLDSVLSQAVLLPGITPSFDNQVYSSPVNAFSTVQDTDFSLDLQYRLGDLTLGSTTAYQHEKQVNAQDIFAVDRFFWNNLTNPSGSDPAAPPPFGDIQTQWMDIKQLSEELKLVSPTDQTLSYVVGLFYSDSKYSLHYYRPLVPAWLDYVSRPETKTTDLYGRATWKFAQGTSLVAGLRYNYDQLSYNYDAAFFPPFLPTVSHSDSSSESSVVGDLSLQHKYSNDLMVYLTYARGYSPAAYNTAAVEHVSPGAPALDLVKKEDVDHFELGTKGTYLDGRLNLNAAAFYTKYKGFQVQIFDQSSTSISPPLVLANAGGAETRGVELDVAFAATDHLRLDLNAAYIDAKFTDYQGASCYYGDATSFIPDGSACFQDLNGDKKWQPNDPLLPEPGPGQALVALEDGTVPGVVQDLTGRVMPNSPKFKFVLGAEQRIPLGGGAWEAVLAGNYSWRDKAQMLVDQNPYGIQSSIGILNLSIGVRKAEGKLSVTAFANNVFDKHYFTDLEDFWSAPWGSNTIVGQPARDTNRYFGLRVSAGF
jgi:iron complex outermembrane receptor protein